MEDIKLKLDVALKESANLIYEIANSHCKNGIMDENCTWYHSIWQYLRMLDVVSSPSWHHNFYIDRLSQAIDNNKNNNILISGTADYSVLAYIIGCVKLKNAKANIYVLDTCKTPLETCKWFAKKENIQINCINESILDYVNDNFFDIICTDAFLTRFSKRDAQLVVDKWYGLLNTGGKVITTIRVHNKKDYNFSSKIDNFINKVKNRYENYKNYISLSYEELVEKALVYAKNMKSNNLGDEKEILNRFEMFYLNYQTNKVVGELSETTYLELVAEKK